MTQTDHSHARTPTDFTVSVDIHAHVTAVIIYVRDSLTCNAFPCASGQFDVEATESQLGCAG